MQLRFIEIPDQLASHLEHYAGHLGTGVDLDAFATALLTREFLQIASEIESNPKALRRILVTRYLDIPQSRAARKQSGGKE